MVRLVPWLPYLAIEYLETILKPHMTIFEWGSGGSTLFFASRVNVVFSIEHDPDWYKVVQESLKLYKFNNVEHRLIEPDKSNEPTLGDKADPAAYLSNAFAWLFKDYVIAIEGYGIAFDVILIDGRARPSCLKHARDRVKPGGYIILDNAEREYYLEQTASFFEGWDKAIFEGHGPLVTWPWKSIFWKRPANG